MLPLSVFASLSHLSQRETVMDFQEMPIVALAQRQKCTGSFPESETTEGGDFPALCLQTASPQTDPNVFMLSQAS